MEQDRVWTLPDGRRFLKLDSGLLLTQLADLKKGKYFGAAIGRIHGYQLDDINRLADLEDLEGIHIQDEIPDLSVLPQLKGLKYILVTGPRQKIDFSTFPVLEELRIGEWNANATGVDKCQRLERLYVRNFKPSKDGLAILAAPNLREAEIVQAPLTSLEGLERFRRLEALIVRYFAQLTDISDVRHVKSTLRKLVFEKCKKIQNWDAVGDLSGLKNLLIMGGSDIPSIAFVSRLEKLESFGLLETTIKDGKLDPLLSLDRLTMVGITDKKHYSHKDAQLKKLIEGRRSSV